VSAYLVSFHDALRTLITTAWTETSTNGCYRDVEFPRFTDLQKKAVANKIPFAVFRLDLNEGDAWGITNRVADGQLTVIYVADDSTSLDAMLAKLETLRDALYTRSNLTVGQVIGYPSIMENVNSPALNAYFAGVQRPFFTGAVTCRVIVGETAP
jgi:hypothetical protein